jgi:MFS family permease
MMNRIKWVLVALGVAFGLQVLISLVYTWIAYSAAGSAQGVPQGTTSAVVFGFALGTYLIGGFVVGWMDDKLRIGDGIVVALLTLVPAILLYLALPEGNRAQFVIGVLLSDPAGNLVLSGRSILFILSGTMASALGAYIGWHATVPQEGIFDRIALALGLLGAIVGPFILLAVGGPVGGHDPAGSNRPGLPWYFLTIVLVLVLVIIAVGFVRFAQESQETDEISISPDRPKKP